MQERNSPKYKEWRKKVLKRDGYRCQHCGAWQKVSSSGCIIYFHGISMKNLRYDIRNGIVLCEACHKLYDENQSILWQIRYRKLKQKYNKLKEKYNNDKSN